MDPDPPSSFPSHRRKKKKNPEQQVTSAYGIKTRSWGVGRIPAKPWEGQLEVLFLWGYILNSPEKLCSVCGMNPFSWVLVSEKSRSLTGWRGWTSPFSHFPGEICSYPADNSYHSAVWFARLPWGWRSLGSSSSVGLSSWALPLLRDRTADPARGSSLYLPLRKQQLSNVLCHSSPQ